MGGILAAAPVEYGFYPFHIIFSALWKNPQTRVKYSGNDPSVPHFSSMPKSVPDPQSVVHACARLVKPGGQVFFSTINRNGKAWLMAVVGAEYVMKMVPKGTHDVKKFIKPAELLGWVDQTTLKEQHIIGLHYNPLTNTFKLAPGVDVNYMLHTTAKQD